MKPLVLAALFVLALAAPAWAGWDEAAAAYKQDDYATALRELRPLAKLGHAGAQNQLGFMYSTGRGVWRDYTEAAKWYRLAAEQGDPKAQFNLGIAYEFGRGVPRNHGEAVKWYREAGGVKNSFGDWRFGSEPECSRSDRQPIVAVRCREAAGIGDLKAQEWLGSSLIRGEYLHGKRGLQQDLVAGAMWLLIAKARGSKNALSRIARFAQHGIAPTQIIEAQGLAREWLRKHPRPEKPGYPDLINREIVISLLYSYHTDTPAPKDKTGALSWYRKAAEQGYIASWELLFDLYVYGRDMTKIDPALVGRVRDSARQGDPGAWYILFLFGNDGVRFEDDAEAFRWSLKAADQGNAGAQIILGFLYENGKGVSRDFVQSNVWLNLAATQFSRIAAKNSDDIINDEIKFHDLGIKEIFKTLAEQTIAIAKVDAENMTPAQIVEAQRLAREWLEKHEKGKRRAAGAKNE